MRVSIVTPWYNHDELLGSYLTTVTGADEVILVDNGSDERIARQLEAHADVYLRRGREGWFAPACNEGLAASTGDIVVFLNNDVSGPTGWLEMLRSQVTNRGLYGPSFDQRAVQLPNGRPLWVPYLEGWCVAATRAVWVDLGGWDAEAYPNAYWEDVDLSFRARLQGYTLNYCPAWDLRHPGNTTSRMTPGSYDHSSTNQRTFENRVLTAWKERNAARKEA